jgi:hypothetical protein
MLKGVCVFLCAIACFGTIPAQAQIGTDDLLRSMKMNQLEHPYLLFSNADKPVCSELRQSGCKISAGLLAEHPLCTCR